MSTYLASLRLVQRATSLWLAAAALTGLSATAKAQTAPQLLPYTAKVVAGGGTAAIAQGALCPISGLTSLDAYGDGCLATEIQLSGPRYAAADAKGNVFFSDYTNGLVRRVDATTGVVTAVAGGASSSPAANTACGAYTSTDSRGDGCLGTAVRLSHPVGLAFSPAGDLYFGDSGYANVRKIAATAGVITTSGVITLAAGNVAGTYGYTSNFGTTTINAATQSYLDGPFGVAFDTNGNLFIADEYKEAVLVVNTNTTATTTVAGVSIPPGTISKILGATTGGGSVCPNSPASTNGCNYGSFTSGAAANSSLVDAPYGVAADAAGNVYFANEYNNNAGKIDITGILTNYAGIQGTVAKVLKRAPAGSFAIGSPFGIAADTASNVYITDASSGVIWRVDGAGQSMYVVAGGATALCSAATDTYGDGCPATQSKFGSSGTTFATASSPGIFGVSVDSNSNLYVGDSISNLVRQVSSGTQFGPVGAGPTTQTVDIHFPSGDAASTYTLTTGSSSFSLGTAACTLNSDGTTDCLLPITATPTTLGAFTGTLQVKSTLGATGTFPLSGTYIMSPETRTVVAVTGSTSCTGTSTYSTTAPLTLTASIVSTGSPSGTVTFFANGTQIGTAQTVSSGKATLSYTFATAGTYAITATYSGDSYFTKSTSPAGTSVTTSAPTFASAAVVSSQSTVAAGQTGLYSFNLVQSVYNGTISLACSGLPAYSSCQFSPSTINATGCSTTNTVALSIVTQQGTAKSASLGGINGKPWTLFSLLPGLGLALLIGTRRRQIPVRIRQLCAVLALLTAASGFTGCGNGTSVPATPSGTYTINVTATGSTGTTASFTVPLTVK